MHNTIVAIPGQQADSQQENIDLTLAVPLDYNNPSSNGSDPTPSNGEVGSYTTSKSKLLEEINGGLYDQTNLILATSEDISLIGAELVTIALIVAATTDIVIVGDIAASIASSYHSYPIYIKGKHPSSPCNNLPK